MKNEFEQDIEALAGRVAKGVAFRNEANKMLRGTMAEITTLDEMVETHSARLTEKHVKLVQDLIGSTDDVELLYPLYGILVKISEAKPEMLGHRWIESVRDNALRTEVDSDLETLYHHVLRECADKCRDQIDFVLFESVFDLATRQRAGEEGRETWYETFAAFVEYRPDFLTKKHAAAVKFDMNQGTLAISEQAEIVWGMIYMHRADLRDPFREDPPKTTQGSSLNIP